MVRLLLSKSGIDINKTNHKGCTALYQASKYDNGKVVRLLLSKCSIDVNKAEDEGVTPLFIACQNNHANVVMQLLDIEDIDVNQPMSSDTSNGCTPLILSTYLGHDTIVRLLLQHPGIDKAVTCNGKDAAQWAQANSRYAQWEMEGIEINVDGRSAIRTLFDGINAAGGEVKSGDNITARNNVKKMKNGKKKKSNKKRK